MGIVSKIALGALLLAGIGLPALADDAFTEAIKPSMQAFIDCVKSREPDAAKSSQPAPAAADAAIEACHDKLDALKAVLIENPDSNSSGVDAEGTAHAVVDGIRPDVIKQIGALRGAL